MALVTTLWSLALMAAIAISLSFTGDISYRLAQNSFQSAYDDALAEAAVSRAVLGLLDPRPDHHQLLTAGGQPFDFGGASMQIRVRDELGKIDLNQTDGLILIQLLESAGLDPVAAEAQVDKILDWRDSNPGKRLNGAKADDYRAAGYHYLPRNGPFQSVDELTLVMGMTHNLFARIEPALTVYSARPFVDPRSAPPEVLSALPSLANALAAEAQQPAAIQPGFGGFGAPLTALQGRAFTVDVAVSRPTGVVRRESAVRLTGNPSEPFWILMWRRS